MSTLPSNIAAARPAAPRNGPPAWLVWFTGGLAFIMVLAVIVQFTSRPPSGQVTTTTAVVSTPAGLPIGSLAKVARGMGTVFYSDAGQAYRLYDGEQVRIVARSPADEVGQRMGARWFYRVVPVLAGPRYGSVSISDYELTSP